MKPFLLLCAVLSSAFALLASAPAVRQNSGTETQMASVENLLFCKVHILLQSQEQKTHLFDPIYVDKTESKAS